MLRSVHMKLVMIMVLLILSLMAVVGAFLINSVMAFYLEEFYTQMSQVFDQSQNPALSRTLQTENSGEENGAEAVLEIMQAYSGELGLDGRSRTLYILDGETGAYLAGTDEAEGRGLEYNSPNLTRALVEKEEGTQANIAADYMDVALPFSRGDGQYVIYILDNKTTVNSLINQIFVLILESLVFGLFISILLSFLLSKTMIIPIQRLTEGAMRVAEGDFSRRIEVTSRDEIGVLTDTFNDMARQLRDTLRQVENERNKLDTLFLHMTDGVVAFDREGRVIHSNPAAAVMLGCTIGGDTTYGQLFGGLGCCQLSVAAGSQYGGVQAVRHSGQSRAFKCWVKWEIHKSHHAVVGFHHQRVHQACRCGSRTASDGIRQTAGSAHDGSTHILVQQKVDQNRRFFRVLAAAVDGKGQIYFRKSAVGLPAKGDLIPYQKAAGIF